MTKGHIKKLAKLLRYAADNEDTLFTYCNERFTFTIEEVLQNPDRDWKIYTPFKPDIVSFIPYYKSDNCGSSYFSIEEATKVRSDYCKHVIKITQNSETGKVTLEVIEL